MSYAIIIASGKQHRVRLGERLKLDTLPGQVGDSITFDQVLLLKGEAEDPIVGAPLVANASVEAKIVLSGRGPKIRVFKRRRRKGFHKTIGHRQNVTEVQITAING